MKGIDLETLKQMNKETVEIEERTAWAYWKKLDTVLKLKELEEVNGNE